MVKISLNTYEHIQALDACRLHTSLIVKSENQSVSGFDLYGFFNESEKDLFDKLISVSGVGAATARMMLSTFKPDDIKNAILSENESMIQSIKGIGPKSAKRIILELKDKLGKLNTDAVPVATSHNTIKEEALSALLALGFNKQAAEKALVKLLGSNSNQPVENLIKEALKVL